MKPSEAIAVLKTLDESFNVELKVTHNTQEVTIPNIVCDKANIEITRSDEELHRLGENIRLAFLLTHLIHK